MSMSEIEKTCENCEYELEDMEGMHCRHCIHNAEEHFMQKEIHYTEQEIRNKAIDDFLERIKEHTRVVGSTTCEDLYEIAEQMKGE